ncbi:hypothetical protein COMNV_01684 [Commensalibacter sp. Nvir]|uniref:hypothetical protein n=1 Tax=Commensalibacter sp. Nvir TaxID=3069817 RepID=UPI002D57CF9B|nr:hypothetical protein COMNV_01684 [Commensalibacter sp. Nvir]
MSGVFLKSIGVYHQHAKNFQELSELVALGIALDPEENDLYQVIAPEILNKKMIKREDRAVLNFNSKIVLNALSDLGERQALDALSKATLYSVCDPSESDYSDIREVLTKYPGKFMENLSELKLLNNPLDLLRLLPTNPLYHVSKVLENHSEGTPLRAASSGGLTALKLAHADISYGTAQNGALIINSANMLAFNKIVMFKKFGELRQKKAQQSGIIPTWGGVVAYLDHDCEHSLAEVLTVTQIYQPAPRYEKHEWLRLFGQISDAYGIPDVVISYENGILSQGKAEREAIAVAFPDVPVFNYKALTGYGGAINNFTDIACAVSDARIPAGARVLFNGAGVMHGLGGALLKINREFK